MNLRPYQTQAISGIQDKFRQGYKSVCLVLMMGLGKTIISCRIMQLIYEKKNRTLFLAHRTFLVTQVRDKLLRFNLPCGIIKSGFKEDRSQKIQVASIQTLKNRLLPPADVVIVDECHRAVSKEYLIVLNKYKEAGAKIIGLTATPFRTNSREGLDTIFDSHVNTIAVKEAVDKGYIVESKVFLAKKFVDTTGMKKSKGDFDEKELFIAFDNPEVYSHFIDRYHARIGNKKTLVFCVNKEHCRKTHEALTRAGYKGNYIISDTNEEERSLYLEMLVKGQYDYIVNCDVYSEGFDEPTIEAIALCFDTTSKNKYFQRAGRGNRPLPEDEGLPFEKRKKKFFTILDMAGNTDRFKWIEYPFEINLAPQTTKEKSGVAPIKSCPNSDCGFMMPAQLKKCPECGMEMIVTKSKKEIEQEEFVELDKKRMEVQKYMDLPSSGYGEIPSELLEAFGKAKGYKKGWCRHVLQARGEGRKKLVIRNYDQPDYHKQCNILAKGYFEKTYPIDAHTWEFIEETENREVNGKFVAGQVVFEYKLAEKEAII